MGSSSKNLQPDNISWPPPRSHLVRWSGVFAPNSLYRKEITLKPEAKKGFDFKEIEDGAGGRRKNYTWSKMLA
jgi:hypothetical protein